MVNICKHPSKFTEAQSQTTVEPHTYQLVSDTYSRSYLLWSNPKVHCCDNKSTQKLSADKHILLRRTATQKQDGGLVRLALSSTGSSSSGLLPPRQRAASDDPNRCVFRSCSEYVCAPLFCKLRETTSCHILAPLQPPLSVLCLGLCVGEGVFCDGSSVIVCSCRALRPWSARHSLWCSLPVSPTDAAVPADWLRIHLRRERGREGAAEQGLQWEIPSLSTKCVCRMFIQIKFSTKMTLTD